MFHPTPTEKAFITAAALQIGVRPDDLNALISFESNYNPQAKNPYSSARGILQFTDAAAQGLGYKNSYDLTQKNKTFAAQIKNAAIPYLLRYAPFPSQQSLYLSVFYPAARSWPDTQHFPDHIKKINPGINTVRDYINLVNSKKSLPFIVPFSIILVVTLLFLFTRRQSNEEKED